MGTRSRIAVENKDGSFTSIYCHWDGYPTCAGATLALHYTDPEKVAKLIKLGDISSLREEIGRKHSFDSRNEKYATWTLAYGRDRGEKNIDATAHADFADLVATDSSQEWLYLYRGGLWYFSRPDVNDMAKMTPMIPEAIRRVAKRLGRVRKNEWEAKEYRELADMIEMSTVKV